MRRGLFAVQRRHITGVAPTIFIPKVSAEHSRESQIEKNTQSALELLRAVKGNKPAPYTRKHKATFDELSREVESLLGSAAKLRRTVKDNEPLDKIGAMERTLRHAMWSYMKDEGNYDFAQMEKWLVYTQSDQVRLASLRQAADKKSKYAAFKAKRDPAAPQTSLPAFDLPKEYDNVVDREFVVEKRLRYNTLGLNTTARNDAAIDAEMAQYIRPTQEKRLDGIVDLLEKFKPILAREAILQRLTVKHLEGQLGLWRYLDWNPEVRDRAEIEADHYSNQWWYTHEEKRLNNIRLRSVNELAEIVEKNQSRRIAESGSRSAAASGDATNAAREKLLAEIIRLQSRQSRKEDVEEASSDDKKKVAAPVEDTTVKVAETVVAEKGLLGLDFIGTGSAKAQA